MLSNQSYKLDHGCKENFMLFLLNVTLTGRFSILLFIDKKVEVCTCIRVYRKCSIYRPERLFKNLTLRVGAYSRVGGKSIIYGTVLLFLPLLETDVVVASYLCHRSQNC